MTDNASCKWDPVTETVRGAPYCEEICRYGGWLPEPEEPDKTHYLTCLKDGVPLSGNTGASRPTMVILPESDGFQTLIGYEQTKGMGHGGDKDEERDDWGKNAFFHSFPFNSPDVVTPGTQLNLPEFDEPSDVPLTTDDGLLVYHNARRVRIIAQPAKNMGSEGLAAYFLWREGPEGHGQPAHIMGRRMLGGHSPAHLECTALRWVNTKSGYQEFCAKGVEDLNAGQWPEADGDLTDARAHRGFVRGDFLAILYTFTTKWGRGEGKPYDVYLRRSFNGGRKWTSFDNGKEEEPRNLSVLRYEADAHGGWSTMEPRLVATPGTIKNKGAVLSPSDVQNDMVFYVAWCTTHNPHAGGGRALQDGMPLSTDVPKDIYYTYTENYGETFKMIFNDGSGKWQYPWLAHTTGPPGTPDDALQSYGAPQMKITPSGEKMWATFEGNSDASIAAVGGGGAGPCASAGQAGSDVCYNGTVIDPFVAYDVNGDSVVDTEDLWTWQRSCKNDNLKANNNGNNGNNGDNGDNGNNGNNGNPNCDELPVSCDIDGDGQLTGHDMKLLQIGIEKYSQAQYESQLRRAAYLRRRNIFD